MIKKIILIICIILFNAVFANAAIVIYSEIRDSDVTKLNVGQDFLVDIKFNASDTPVYSLTTLMIWDSTAVRYISHTNNLTWECSGPVDNVNPGYPDNDTAAGRFFWDYAGSDPYIGVRTAHTITFRVLQKKAFTFNIVLGNVIDGGFSGSGVMTENSEVGKFYAITADSDAKFDTDITLDTNISLTNDLNNVVIYPNPFVPNDGHFGNGVTIEADALRGGIHIKNITANCKIEIYTLLGELVDEFQTTTEPKLRWDGKNKSGRDCASGVYFIMLKNGMQKVIKKVTIIR